MLGVWGSFFTLTLAGLGLSLLSQFIYKKFTDQEKIEEVKKKTEELQKKMKEADMKEKAKYQTELLELSMKRMELGIKPLIISTLVFFGVFPILRYFSHGFILLKFSPSLPIIQDDIGWFLTYLIVSFIGNSIFRKILNEDQTGS